MDAGVRCGTDPGLFWLASERSRGQFGCSCLRAASGSLLGRFVGREPVLGDSRGMAETANDARVLRELSLIRELLFARKEDHGGGVMAFLNDSL